MKTDLSKYEKEITQDGYAKTLARILCKFDEVTSKQEELETKIDSAIDAIEIQGNFIDDVVTDAVALAVNEEAFSGLEEMLSEHKKSIDESCKKIASVFLRALNNQKIITKIGE